MQTAQQPLYRERLWPSVGVATFGIVMVLSLGVAVAREYGFALGAEVTVALLVVSVLSTILFTASISVTESGLQAGKALIPWACVGTVTMLDKSATLAARSAKAHPNAYFCIRSWIPESLIVQITDESDPHPYWHLSSRHSQELKTAIESQL